MSFANKIAMLEANSPGGSGSPAMADGKRWVIENSREEDGNPRRQNREISII